jgi:hypothetical protein
MSHPANRGIRVPEALRDRREDLGPEHGGCIQRRDSHPIWNEVATVTPRPPAGAASTAASPVGQDYQHRP